MTVVQVSRIRSQCLCLLWLIIFTVQGFKCPLPETIEPCECYDSGNIGCYFKDNITQESVNNLFAKLREINGVSPHENFHFPAETGEFTIRNSIIEEFDLTPFVNTTMNRIFLGDNAQLKTIKGPPLSMSQGLISVNWLSVLDYGIDDVGFGETLKYFNPETLVRLHLLHNNLTGSAQDTETGGELFPGFWNLKNLEEIDLEWNPIRKISSKQFASFRNLSDIRLHGSYATSDTLILEKDAFSLHPEYNEHNMDKTLKLDLSSNNLNDSYFNIKELGLLNYPNVSISLSLGSNKFEGISQTNFQPFLDINEKNELHISSNPIKCRNRQSLKWLQDQPEKYASRVPYVFCDGDITTCTIFQASRLTHVCRLGLSRLQAYLQTLATVIALSLG